MNEETDKTTLGVVRTVIQLCVGVSVIVLGGLIVRYGNITFDTNSKVASLIVENTNFRDSLAEMKRIMVTQDQLKVATLENQNKILEFQNQVLSLLKKEKPVP